MIRCDNCGTDNLDGSEYCDECGVKLDFPPQSVFRANRAQQPPAYQPPTGENASEARNGDGVGRYQSGAPGRGLAPPSVDVGPPRTADPAVPSPPSFTTSTSIPKPARPAREGRSVQTPPNERPEGGGPPPEILGPSKTMVLSSRGKTDALKSDVAQRLQGTSITSKLIIERGGRLGREFPIATVETHIGRWDADSGIFPDVDLDQDDPEAKVSRRHARIINQNGQYFIEDLGSTNGTFVNRGRRLLPGHRHLLQSGDEIIVGKTFLKFHIIS
jgi:hypothetical protein